MITLPKDNDKYKWTNHAKDKMIYYRISESLVKRIVRFPKRTEAGIAPGTTACMQSVGSKKRPSEVWVMYVDLNQKVSRNKNHKFLVTPKKKIITAWRYPGISPIGEPIPIPEEILAEISQNSEPES